MSKKKPSNDHPIYGKINTSPERETGIDRKMRALVVWKGKAPAGHDVEFVSMVPPITHKAPAVKSHLSSMLHNFTDDLHKRGVGENDWRVVYHHNPEYSRYVKESVSGPVFVAPIMPSNIDLFAKSLRKARHRTTTITEQHDVARQIYGEEGGEWYLSDHVGVLSFMNKANILQRLTEYDASEMFPVEHTDAPVTPTTGPLVAQHGAEWKEYITALAWKNVNQKKS